MRGRGRPHWAAGRPANEEPGGIAAGRTAIKTTPAASINSTTTPAAAAGTRQATYYTYPSRARLLLRTSTSISRKRKKKFGCRPAVGTVATLNSRTLRAASPGTHGPYLVFNLGGVMSRYGEKIWGTRPGYRRTARLIAPRLVLLDSSPVHLPHRVWEPSVGAQQPPGVSARAHP